MPLLQRPGAPHKFFICGTPAGIGTGQLNMPDALEMPPISDYGNVLDISGKFSRTDQLLAGVGKLHELLYAA
ncbi:MAG: hypothetical protein U0746_20470 [Gemmataceae bacterium]